jgi:hypothetical protein
LSISTVQQHANAWPPFAHDLLDSILIAFWWAHPHGLELTTPNVVTVSKELTSRAKAAGGAITIASNVRTSLAATPSWPDGRMPASRHTAWEAHGLPY